MFVKSYTFLGRAMDENTDKMAVNKNPTVQSAAAAFTVLANPVIPNKSTRSFKSCVNPKLAAAPVINM